MRYTKNSSGMIEPESDSEYRVILERRRYDKKLSNMENQLAELRKILNV